MDFANSAGAIGDEMKPEIVVPADVVGRLDLEVTKI